MRLRILALFIVSLLILSSLAACSDGKSTVTTPAAQAPGQAKPQGGPPGGPGGAGFPNPFSQGTTPTPSVKTILGDGFISVAGYAKLSFGSAGQITEINVKPGDHVTAGTVLARLDTNSLETSLSQAKINLEQAQITRVQMSLALEKANLAQIQAESNLVTAQFNLDKVTPVCEIKDRMTTLQNMIAAAKVSIRRANIIGDSHEVQAMNEYMTGLESELEREKSRLSSLLKNDQYTGAKSLSYDPLGQTYDRLTIEDARIKELAVQSAQKVLDQTKMEIELAQKNLEKASDSIDLAQQNLEMIQVQIQQAKITAPFEGIVAAVNREVNDFTAAPAQSQTPVIYLVDTSSMQLEISVNELDIPGIKTGQKADIYIDAYPGLKLEGRVDSISILPSTQSSVVDYTVTLSFDTPESTDIKVGMHASATIVTQ